MRALIRLADAIDALSGGIGRVVKWLAVLLVIWQFAVVVLRYGFGTSFAWAQEAVFYIDAALFMLAIGYAYMLDAHVRVDFFSANWSERTRAGVEIACILLCVLPFCALLVWASWGYVMVSFRLNEGAMMMGGLPLVPYLKALILVMAGLLGLQSVSVLIRAVAALRGEATQLFPRRQAVGEA